jgi:hypothetical protein
MLGLESAARIKSHSHLFDVDVSSEGPWRYWNGADWSQTTNFSKGRAKARLIKNADKASYLIPKASAERIWWATPFIEISVAPVSIGTLPALNELATTPIPEASSVSRQIEPA